LPVVGLISDLKRAAQPDLGKQKGVTELINHLVKVANNAALVHAVRNELTKLEHDIDKAMPASGGGVLVAVVYAQNYETSFNSLPTAVYVGGAGTDALSAIQAFERQANIHAGYTTPFVSQTDYVWATPENRGTVWGNSQNAMEQSPSQAQPAATVFQGAPSGGTPVDPSQVPVGCGGTLNPQDQAFRQGIP
jgi:hypothetical protein